MPLKQRADGSACDHLDASTLKDTTLETNEIDLAFDFRFEDTRAALKALE